MPCHPIGPAFKNGTLVDLKDMPRSAWQVTDCIFGIFLTTRPCRNKQHGGKVFRGFRALERSSGQEGQAKVGSVGEHETMQPLLENGPILRTLDARWFSASPKSLSPFLAAFRYPNH